MPRSRLSTLIALATIAMLSAALADVPDGRWNGKPWEPGALDKGVAAMDRDALAEWAYCSNGGYDGIFYQPELIMRRARQAADKGSLLGKYLLGICYTSGIPGIEIQRDPAKGVALFKESMEGGHPLGRWKILVFQRHGMYNMEKDTRDAVKKMEACLEDGVLEAHRSLGGIYRSGQAGEIDFEKSIHHYKLAFRKFRNISVANTIIKLKTDRKGSRGFLSHLTEEDFLLAKDLLVEAGELGHLYSTYIVGVYEIRIGDVHRGIPRMIEAANDPDIGLYLEDNQAALLSINELIVSGRRSNVDGSNAAIGDYRSGWRAAKVCYASGMRNPFVNRMFADSVFGPRGKEKVSEKDERMAVDLLRDLIKKGHGHRSHHLLGEYFLGKYEQQKSAKEDFDRGMAHLVYHSTCHSSSHWICAYYLTGKRSADLAKGVAAAEWAITLNDGAWRKAEERWLESARKKLTEEQREESEMLIKDGFPHAQKFQREAFELLKEFGDIPGDRQFKEVAPEKKSYEEASTPLRLNLLYLAASIFAIVQIDGSVPEFSPEEDALMKRYLSGDRLAEGDAPKLVRLLVSDDEKLRALLEKNSDGDHAERASKIYRSLGSEHLLGIDDSRIGAAIGWYLSYEGGKVSSRPYITRALKDSATLRAGFKIADVIEKCNGIEMRMPQSRNLFVRLIDLWPPAEPLEIEVSRNKTHADPVGRNIKDKRKQIKLVIGE